MAVLQARLAVCRSVKMKISMKKLIPCITLLLGMVLLGGCSVGRRNMSISPYILADVSGLSGRASATVYLDTAGIYSALAGTDATQEQKDEYKSFVESLTLSCDKLDKLANGDVINMTVTYDGEEADRLKLNVNDFVKSYNVQGLDEGQEIDVFKDLKVEVTGIAPYAFVTYTNNSTDPYIKNLEYVIEGKTTGLQNGDIITIKCMIDEKTAELYYYYTDVTTMSYTVEGLDTYIYDSEQLDKQVLSGIAAECADTIRSETDDTTMRMLYKLTGSSNYLYQDNNEWVDNIKLNQVIFLTRSAQGASPYENVILYVFEAAIANNNYTEYGFFIFEYTNAIRNGSGEFMIGRNNPELRYVCGLDFDELHNNLVKDMEYQYSTELLDGITMEENAQ